MKNVCDQYERKYVMDGASRKNKVTQISSNLKYLLIFPVLEHSRSVRFIINSDLCFPW